MTLQTMNFRDVRQTFFSVNSAGAKQPMRGEARHRFRLSAAGKID
jgi:hypothetical protein